MASMKASSLGKEKDIERRVEEKKKAPGLSRETELPAHQVSGGRKKDLQFWMGFRETDYKRRLARQTRGEKNKQAQKRKLKQRPKKL